jgi:hypothetical protein
MAKDKHALSGAAPTAAPESGQQPPEFAKAIGAFLETYQRSMAGLVEQLKSAKGVRWGDPAQVLEWMKKSAAFPAALPGLDAKGAFASPLDAASLAGAIPGDFAKHPLLAGLRHVFAGAHDAVGWGLYSRLAEVMSEIGAADLAARESQAKVWTFMGEIWQKAQARFGEELKAMQARGESFADVQAFLRAWTRALDPVAHEALQSGPGLEVTTAAMRAAMRLRAAQNRAVELVSEIYNVPTRAEVDEAYRMIHELRKEVRALRKGTD